MHQMDLHRIEEYMARVSKSEHVTFPSKGELKVGLDLGTAYIVLVVLDENNEPVACEKQFAEVLRDGVVVDYTGALDIVKRLKSKLEERIGRELKYCAIAMPAGTESSVRTHKYVAEGAGFEVTAVMDEPTAANAVYHIRDGVIVDIGGGTTGMAVLKDGAVTKVADEPTGGTHLTLVIAGNRRISFAEAEKLKTDKAHQRELIPIVKPVIEKMATIIKRNVSLSDSDTIYLCGGTCCLPDVEKIIADVTGVETIKPADPFLVTPTGIAMSCITEERQ